MLRVRSVWMLAGLIGLSGWTGFSAVRPAPATKPAHKKEPQVQALDLHRGGETVAMAPPMNIADFGYKCDLEGDIFLAYASYQAGSRPTGMIIPGKFPVSEITPDTAEIVRYPMPERIPAFQGPVFRLGFDVTSDGTLYALFNTSRRSLDGKWIPEFVIAEYNDDGTVDSYTPIQGQVSGERLQPMKMAVFGNGDFLVGGMTVRAKHLGGAFTGVFDSSGDLVRLVTLGKHPTAVPYPSKSPPAGKSAKPLTRAEKIKAYMKAYENSPAGIEGSTLSFSGKDGNVYMLQGRGQAMLYVIDSQGEVLHKFPIDAPKAGLTPVQMVQAGPSHLYIYYVHMATGAKKENVPQRSMIDVLSTATGKVTAVYRMPEVKGMLIPGCAESASKFTFLGMSKDHHLALISYSTQ